MKNLLEDVLNALVWNLKGAISLGIHVWNWIKFMLKDDQHHNKLKLKDDLHHNSQEFEENSCVGPTLWGNDLVGDSPMASCPISVFEEVVSHKSDYIGSSLSWAKLPDDHHL